MTWRSPRRCSAIRNVTALVGGPFDRAAIAARLATELANQATHGDCYWLLHAGDSFVGCCGLKPREPGTHELGFYLCRAYWGGGYAVEAGRAVIDHAFGALDADALFAGHHPANHGSRAVLAKLGFRYAFDELYHRPGSSIPVISCVTRAARHRRPCMRHFPLALLVGSPAAPPPRARPCKPTDEAPLVIELFTSQGCSSCPPADALLAKLATAGQQRRPRRSSPLPLSRRLLERPRLGRSVLDARVDRSASSEYARALGDDRVYTPELVVGGGAGMVGSQAASGRRARSPPRRSSRRSPRPRPGTADASRSTRPHPTAPTSGSRSGKTRRDQGHARRELRRDAARRSRRAQARARRDGRPHRQGRGRARTATWTRRRRGRVRAARRPADRRRARSCRADARAARQRWSTSRLHTPRAGLLVQPPPCVAQSL